MGERGESAPDGERAVDDKGPKGATETEREGGRRELEEGADRDIREEREKREDESDEGLGLCRPRPMARSMAVSEAADEETSACNSSLCVAGNARPRLRFSNLQAGQLSQGFFCWADRAVGAGGARDGRRESGWQFLHLDLARVRRERRGQRRLGRERRSDSGIKILCEVFAIRVPPLGAGRLRRVEQRWRRARRAKHVLLSATCGLVFFAPLVGRHAREHGPTRCALCGLSWLCARGQAVGEHWRV